MKLPFRDYKNILKKYKKQQQDHLKRLKKEKRNIPKMNNHKQIYWMFLQQDHNKKIKKENLKNFKKVKFLIYLYQRNLLIQI